MNRTEPSHSEITSNASSISTKKKNILVAGATGIAGSSFLAHCLGTTEYSTKNHHSKRNTTTGEATQLYSAHMPPPINQYPAPESWRYTGLSRNAPKDINHPRVKFVQIDLLGDISALEELNDITHLIFAGYKPEADPRLQLEHNAALLKNCLRGLYQSPLEHIVLIQGMKYYGSHKGKFKTPAKENDPRLAESHYYYAQQDLVQSTGVEWTCLRPHVICGTTALGYSTKHFEHYCLLRFVGKSTESAFAMAWKRNQLQGT